MHLSKRGEMCVVELVNRDFRDPLALQDLLEAVVGGPGRLHTVLDFSCVETIPDAGVDAIFSARAMTRAVGGRFSIAGVSDGVRRALASDEDSGDLASYVSVDHAERTWRFRPPS